MAVIPSECRCRVPNKWQLIVFWAAVDYLLYPNEIVSSGITPFPSDLTTFPTPPPPQNNSWWAYVKPHTARAHAWKMKIKTLPYLSFLNYELCCHEWRCRLCSRTGLKALSGQIAAKRKHISCGVALSGSTKPTSEVWCCFPAQMYAGLRLVWLDPDPHAAPPTPHPLPQLCVVY